MPSDVLAEYIDSLKRCDLDSLNANFPQFAFVESDPSRFQEEGVLVAENVFSSNEIDRVRLACQRLDDLARNERVSYSDINLEAAGGGWKGQDGTTISHAGTIRRVKNLIDHGDEFRELAFHPSLLRIVAALVGPNFRLHSKGFLMNTPANVSSGKPWHQDGAYFDTEDQVIIVWIPLQDVTAVNGCLHAISGSHNWGKLEHRGAEAQLDPAALPLDLVRQYPVRSGGVCVMEKHTSPSTRRAILFRYQAAPSRPVPTASLCATHSSIRRLGGQLSRTLALGDKESTIEKRHLIIARVLRQHALAENIEFTDMGTDYLYPFYDGYKPTQDALQALGVPAVYARVRWSVDLDWKTEVMINTGASQAFDAMSRAFEGRYVLLPALSLPTVGVVTAGNGADLLRLPLDPNNGMIDIPLAQGKMDNLPAGSVRFLYLNSPVNPTGQVASLDYLTQLVEFARRNGITVLHDMDSWYTHHAPASKLHNILEVPGAMDCCVTVLSVSKEFGLPGLRVGLIAGNAAVVNAIRMQNSTFAVMIPEVCQVAAQAALESFIDDVGDDNNDKAAGSKKDEINTLVTSVLKRTIEGWTSLGWPEDAIHTTVAGFKYLASVPPGLSPQGRFSPVELLDFCIASRAHVKLSTSRSFNPENDRFLRMVLMQNVDAVDEVFKRLRAAGIHYQMSLPDGLAGEYEIFLAEHARSDF